MAEESEYLKEIKQLEEKKIKEFKKEQRKKELVNKRAKLEQKRAELIDQCAYFTAKKGEEDAITQLLLNTLDLTYKLDEVFDIVQGIDAGMNYLFETMEFFDEAFDSWDSLMEGSLEKKYGFFQRLKTKMRYRKALRNQQGRMVSIGNRIQDMFNMVNGSTKGISGIVAKLNKINVKNNKKKQKQGQSAGTFENKEMMDLVRAKAAKLKEDNPNQFKGSGAAPTGGKDDDDASLDDAIPH